MIDATPPLLQRVGEALYGPRWQTELAGALGVADRTVRRWLSGETPVPPGVYTDCHRLVLERTLELDALDEPLKQAAAP